MKCLIEFKQNAPIGPMATEYGIHVRSQAASVESVAWIKHGTRRLIDG
jgi:hypothetical protein